MKKEEIGMLWDMYRTLVPEERARMRGFGEDIDDTDSAKRHGREVAALALAYLDAFLDVALAAVSQTDNGREG